MTDREQESICCHVYSDGSTCILSTADEQHTSSFHDSMETLIAMGERELLLPVELH